MNYINASSASSTSERVRTTSHVIKRLIADVLMFGFIFNFEIVKGLALSSSTYVSMLILLFIIVFDGESFRLFINAMSKQYFKLVMALFTALIGFALIVAVLHNKQDYTYVLSLIKACVAFLFCIILYVVIQKRLKISILDVLIDVYILQSIIICISFFNPTFKSITDIFRSDNSLIISERYDGYRGLAIAGSAYYGLAISYAFLYMVVALHWKQWSVSTITLRIMLCAIMVFAGITAGRTSAIGLPFALLLSMGVNVGTRKNIKYKSSSIIIASLGAAAACIVLLIVSTGIVTGLEIPAQLEIFCSYALSFFQNFNPNDIMSSISSTETLSNMYFPLNLQQLAIGDGLYTTASGGYYLGTDAGYMRTILFFGVFGLLLIFLCEIAILLPNTEKKSKVFSGFVFILLCVLQYKGEALITPLCLGSMIGLVQINFHLKDSI